MTLHNFIRNDMNIRKIEEYDNGFTREQNGHNFERFSIYECAVDNFIFLLLTHLSLASLLWDIGKQYSPRCDAAERGVPCSAASHLGLFCLHRQISSKNEIKKIKITPNTPKNENDNRGKLHSSNMG